MVGHRDMEVDLISLLFVKREDGNEVRINSIARMDVNGVEHTVTINGEDRFKEGTHGQVMFSQVINKRADVNVDVNGFALFLKDLNAREIRLELISKFCHSIIEERGRSKSKLLTSKVKRVSERFNNQHVFLKHL